MEKMNEPFRTSIPFLAPCTDVLHKIMHKIITCYLNLMRQGPLQMSTGFVGLDSLAAMVLLGKSQSKLKG